jgi:type 1 fimbriae regulatory protein FimB
MNAAAAVNIVPFPAKRQRRAKRNGMTFLTPDEVLAVLKVAKERSARDHAAILLAYKHGLRASEVCGMKLAQIDLKNRQLDIPRLKGSLRTCQPLAEHKGDNRSLFDELVVLKRWLAERIEDGSGYVFLSQKGGALSRKQFFCTFRAIALAAGVSPEKAHPHSLKHSRATNLISKGVGLMEVKTLLGHKSIGSTVQYIGMSDQQASEAARRADAEMF